MKELYAAAVANVHYVAGPMILVSLYRLIVCKAEINQIKKKRKTEKKFLSCSSQYGEMGLTLFALPFFVIAFFVPALWPFWLAGVIVCGYYGKKAGEKKAEAVDDHWRSVGKSLQKTDSASAVETEEYKSLGSDTDEK